MKKILTSLLGLGLVMSLAACFGPKKSSSSSKSSEASSSSETSSSEESSQSTSQDPLDVVLADEASFGWAVHGNFLLADGETVNGWNGKDNELYEASAMTAISINQAKAIDATVGAALEAKDVKHLYKYEGAILGVNDAGWTAKFREDGKLYKANGSYVFKAVKLSYDAEEEVYAEEAWIPDPHLAYAECLTGNMFIPPFQETPDEDGFSWASDQSVIGGAGVYTIIVAEYNNAVSADTPNYGIAAVKTEARDGHAYEEIVEYVPEDHTYGLVGTFTGWADDADVEMTRDGENLKWEGVATLDAEDQVKVRADGKWDYSWGSNAVDAEHSATTLDLTGDNIVITAAGEYEFVITFVDGVGTIVVSAVA